MAVGRLTSIGTARNVNYAVPPRVVRQLHVTSAIWSPAGGPTIVNDIVFAEKGCRCH